MTQENNMPDVIYVAPSGNSPDPRFQKYRVVGDSEVFMNQEKYIRAALTAPCVPDGWKLVPVEPDCVMIERLTYCTAQSYDEAKERYKAMLAAAPKPEGDV